MRVSSPGFHVEIGRVTETREIKLLLGLLNSLMSNMAVLDGKYVQWFGYEPGGQY